MEIGYLNEVKAILKSLVLSSPNKITVDKLNREYRDIEGEFIPFRRLGFNNLEMFLRSIPDTLLVLGSGHSASVYFVANDKSMHIHTMIMQQKKPKGRVRDKSRPRNRNTFGNEMPMQKFGRNNNNFQSANLPRRSAGQQFSPFQITNRNVSTRTVAVREMPVNRTQANANSDQQRQAAPTTIARKVEYALPQPKGIDINLADNTQKCEPKKQIQITVKQSGDTQVETKPVKAAENSSTLENIKKYQEQIRQWKLGCPQVETTPNESSKNTSALKNTKRYQEDIKQLESLLSTTCHVTASASPVTKNVSFSPETKGIVKDKPCGEKITESLLNNQMREIKMGSSQDNEELQNKLKREDINAGKNKEEDESQVNEFKKLLDISDAKVVDMDEAVPEFAANNQVFRVDFPKHTVAYGRKIPPYKFPESIGIESCIRIFIAEIHNPFKFWFHIHKDEHELDTLMNQIERFYTSLAPNELRIPIMCLNPGQICAACYNDMWHRAEIVAPPVDNKIKVSFLDYGTVSEVNIIEIKYLASGFAQLPAQAIRGSLSHIKPRGLHWSHEATLHFLSSVSELMLFAKITEIDVENLIFYMILCDTHGDEVIQINKELVVKRYAQYNEDWQESKINKNNGRRNHHPREDYPTFSMIESGEYPSFSELVELNQRGIDYEMIHDRIIFNKCSVLNFHDNVPEPIRQLPFFLQTTNPFRTDILLELTGIKATI